jgi:hypothetical protein
MHCMVDVAVSFSLCRPILRPLETVTTHCVVWEAVSLNRFAGNEAATL